MSAAPRYAVYFTPPPAHALWRAGCEWLGRDPAQASPGPLQSWVGEPWRYGFHATLKPPMHLTEGRNETALHDALAQLARRFTRFSMPALAVAPLSGFLALQPIGPVHAEHALRRLADACVVELEPWRAPVAAEKLARRDNGRLDDVQRLHLQRYGYPHVLSSWRFHMTLTNTLGDDAALMARAEREARAHFAPALAEPLDCEAISLFVEPGPGEPLLLTHRFALA